MPHYRLYLYKKIVYYIFPLSVVVRPESVRPIQGVPSVIRLSSSPRQWGPNSTDQQQSVILQHALTTNPPVENETTQIQSGKISREFLFM